jgi:AcrR family transcriptional regulator
VTPPASGRETPLSRDEVVEAALELTRDVGLNRLTMRGLANALGVSPMATYHYVANKEELVQLVAGAVSADWPQLEPSELPWDEVLRQHVLQVWEALRRYPGLGSHLMGLPAAGITEGAVERAVAFFCAAGFPPSEAALAWSVTETYLHGRLSVDDLLSGETGPTRVDDLRARDYVEYAVDILIDGLQVRLTRARSSAAGRSG